MSLKIIFLEYEKINSKSKKSSLKLEKENWIVVDNLNHNFSISEGRVVKFLKKMNCKQRNCSSMSNSAWCKEMFSNCRISVRTVDVIVRNKLRFLRDIFI